MHFFLFMLLLLACYNSFLQIYEPSWVFSLTKFYLQSFRSVQQFILQSMTLRGGKNVHQTDLNWRMRIGTNPSPTIRFKVEFVSGILVFSPAPRTALYSESILLPCHHVNDNLHFYIIILLPLKRLIPTSIMYAQIFHILRCLRCSHYLSITLRSFLHQLWPS